MSRAFWKNSKPHLPLITWKESLWCLIAKPFLPIWMTPFQTFWSSLLSKWNVWLLPALFSLTWTLTWWTELMSELLKKFFQHARLSGSTSMLDSQIRHIKMFLWCISLKWFIPMSSILCHNFDWPLFMIADNGSFHVTFQLFWTFLILAIPFLCKNDFFLKSAPREILSTRGTIGSLEHTLYCI